MCTNKDDKITLKTEKNGCTCTRYKSTRLEWEARKQVEL